MIPDDTSDAIHSIGHRAFIGGNDRFWSDISKLQFDFLVAQGLRPNHAFVDVACGALRAGVQLIPYLNVGKYTGLDKHIELIIYGVAQELGVTTFSEKRPRFIVDAHFNFDAMINPAQFGIAQSLFTHLTSSDIVKCLKGLRPKAELGCRFFATFFESESGFSNPEVSHSHGIFHYTKTEMEGFAEQTGWLPRYIGAWSHPRDQKIIEFIATNGGLGA